MAVTEYHLAHESARPISVVTAPSHGDAIDSLMSETWLRSPSPPRPIARNVEHGA